MNKKFTIDCTKWLSTITNKNYGHVDNQFIGIDMTHIETCHTYIFKRIVNRESYIPCSDLSTTAPRNKESTPCGSLR